MADIPVSLSFWLELLSVIFGLTYVILAGREHIACWFFGLLGSVASVWLFIRAKLYAESALNLYYVVMSVYGWIYWTRGRREQHREHRKIETRSLRFHITWILIGISLSVICFYLLKTFTDAEMPLLDSFTTMFSFIATWLTAKKLLENWIYWVVIDAASIGLYISRDLYMYAGLFVLYTIIASINYLNWRKAMRAEANGR